jgi:hypothetical protein
MCNMTRQNLPTSVYTVQCTTNTRGHINSVCGKNDVTSLENHGVKQPVRSYSGNRKSYIKRGETTNLDWMRDAIIPYHTSQINVATFWHIRIAALKYNVRCLVCLYHSSDYSCNRRVNKKFWKELIAYFPLTGHGPHRKRRLQQLFAAAGPYLPSYYLATTGEYTNTRVQQFFLLCVFVAVRTCLPSRCLAMKGGIHFAEPLSSNDRRDTHTQTDGRDLGSRPMRWAQVPWYTYQIS